MTKKSYRCTVCSDIHYGTNPPEVCPTCSVNNAYVEIESKETKNIIEESNLTDQDIVKTWKDFSEKNDIQLNPDQDLVNEIIKGIKINEERYGLKLCPCRIRDGTKEKDLELICPCNFKTHNTWKEKGECWCGLFVIKK